MKLQATLYLAMILLLMSVSAAAQSSAGEQPVNLFGPDQAAFNGAMQEVMFGWNDYDDPTDKAALKANAQWLKDHPNVRFYIDGYASSRGELIYNLVLSQRRADHIREWLIGQGVSQNQIVMATGWGQLYPVCPEQGDPCWSKNRRVRFEYAPN